MDNELISIGDLQLQENSSQEKRDSIGNLSDSSQRQNNHHEDQTLTKSPRTVSSTKRIHIFQSIWSSCQNVIIFILFILISMITGMLIVYLTSSKPTSRQCQLMLRSLSKRSTIKDSHPYSTTIVDFNNDSYVDIAIANSGTDNIGVFLGYGNGTFTSQIIYSTGIGSIPYKVAVGDFNHDQKVDMAVANFGTNSIGIFLGKGNGNFISQTNFSTGSSRPRYIAVDNFNNDHHLDIVVANSGTNTIGIFLGYGDGTFGTQMTFSTGYDSLPFSLVIYDMNKDNKLDIIVANSGTNNVGLFLGHGDGTFAVQLIFTTGIHSHPYSIIVADFNNDIYIDIAVANSGTNIISVLFGYGNETFRIGTNLSTNNNSSPHAIIAADLNRDNQLDIAVVNYDTNNIGIFLGDGNGNFSNQIIYLTGDDSNPTSISIDDFNNDKQLDIVVANSATNNMGIFLGYTKSTFTSQTTYSTGKGSDPIAVVIGDVNNDGHLDIVVANYHTDNVAIFLGYGTGVFSNLTTYYIGKRTGPLAIGLGDLNNDGWLDIVTANYHSGNIGVSLGHGNGTFGNFRTYDSGYSSAPYSLAIGDLNNDSRLDIAVANYDANNIGIFFGYGDGTFSPQMTYSTGSDSNPNGITIDDFNNDNRLDIAVANYKSWTVGIFLGYGNGTFATQTTCYAGYGTWPAFIATGDFNNDSYVDITIASYAKSYVGVFRGYGNGSFTGQSNYVTGSETADSESYAVAVGDFNKDGRLDITVANYGTSNVGVLLENGDGTFAVQIKYLTGSNSGPISVAVGDFNNDSLPDIVVANSNNDNMGILLGYKQATFSDQTTYISGSSAHPCSVVLGDFNNDTIVDFVLANYGTGSVAVTLGLGNGTFMKERLYSLGSLSFPTSVTVDDFNKDSKKDIAVTNYGADSVGILLGNGNGTFTNQMSYSTGKGSNPQSIATGYFDTDNQLDIVVANYGTNNVRILLKRDTASFASQKEYATGSFSKPIAIAIGDFNHDNQSDMAVTHSESFGVGVFLGYGNGTFSSQTTYFTGEFSTPYGIGVADFTNDNNLDIAFIDNSCGCLALLLGYGNGSFSKERIDTNLGTYSEYFVISDFDNDNFLDVAAANYYSHDLYILMGLGNGSFSFKQSYDFSSESRFHAVAMGDFNEDGLINITITNFGSDSVVILFGLGNGTFSNSSSFSTGTGSKTRGITVADINDDNRLDIIVANQGTNNIGVLFGYGNGNFSTMAAFPTGSGSGPCAVIAGDFNNDKKVDVVVANGANHNIGIHLGIGDGTFFDQIIYSTGNNSSPANLASDDLNHDGRLDIIVANNDRENIGVFLGYAGEGFLNSLAYSTGLSSKPMSVAKGDFNNDTRLDAVVANSGTDNVMILFGSGYGTFVSQTNYSTGNDSNPYSVAVGDLNSDSYLDIVVANSKSDNVGIFLGYGNGTFSNQMIYYLGLYSQPYSVIVSDFDNDTRLDIAVACYGTNNVGILFGFGNGHFSNLMSFASGFGARPFALAAGDVNKDKLDDIIIVNNDYGNVDIISKIC